MDFALSIASAPVWAVAVAAAVAAPGMWLNLLESSSSLTAALPYRTMKIIKGLCVSVAANLVKGRILSREEGACLLPATQPACPAGLQRPRRHPQGAQLTQKALMGGRSAIEVLSSLLLRAALGGERAPPLNSRVSGWGSSSGPPPPPAPFAALA